MDILNIIDRLDALVTTSRVMPGTRSRLVDADKVMEVVEQLRLAIPQDIRAAEEVIERKDNILSQAQIDARRLRSQAEEEFRNRVDQSDVLATARRNAAELVEEAERKATRSTNKANAESERCKSEADAYVTQTLRRLETEMTSVLGTVRRGLDALNVTVPA
jgi:cell division septum initiation protein DivIVA